MHSEGRALFFGPIRQELLSGVSDVRQFNILRNRLRAFSDLSIHELDYERAADFLRSIFRSLFMRLEREAGSRIDRRGRPAKGLGADGHAKPYQVRQLLKIVERHNLRLGGGE